MNTHHEQADRQEHLPHACEVEVLESLQSEPVCGRVPEPAVDAEERADQRAEDNHRERAQEQEGECALPLRLAPGDHRSQEDAGRHERRRDPEDRELHVPGAHQVEGQELREVDAEKARELGAVVLRSGAHQHLDHEQRSHHEEEPGAGALGRRERHVARRAEAERSLLATVPAEDVPAPEYREEQPDPAEQRDQRQHRPDDDVRRGLVLDARLGRPVVRVRVVVPGTLCGARPGRPAEERRERCEVVPVGDRVGT
jgi:hypothetical protein